MHMQTEPAQHHSNGRIGWPVIHALVHAALMAVKLCTCDFVHMHVCSRSTLMPLDTDRCLQHEACKVGVADVNIHFTLARSKLCPSCQSHKLPGANPTGSHEANTAEAERSESVFIGSSNLAARVETIADLIHLSACSCSEMPCLHCVTCILVDLFQ